MLMNACDLLCEMEFIVCDDLRVVKECKLILIIIRTRFEVCDKAILRGNV